MRALSVISPGQLDVRDVPEPRAASADEAIVAIETAGICGTDLSIHSGGIPVSYPRVLGHELLGTVVEAAASGSVAEGTRVLVDPSVSCGRCRQCWNDRAHLCPNGALMGRDVDGGFTEKLAVSERQLHLVPGSVGPEQGAFAQVLGVCVHAQRKATVFPGQSAAVIGLGVTGLMMIQLLRERGVDRIAGITRSPRNRELGEEFGATVTAPPDGAAAAVDELTDGQGADLVVECVGKIPTFAQAIELVGLGGTVVLFGTATATEGSLPFYELYRKEVAIQNPRAALPRDYATAVDLLAADRIAVEPLLSATYDLERGDEAFSSLKTQSGVLKVLLEIA